MPESNDTIAAIATPSGRGGLGIVRVSGPLSRSVFKALTTQKPKPRLAEFVSFYASDKKIIDKGIALFFKAPASFTGEDIMECQVHGSHIVLNLLLQEIISLGARLASPGEFTERAFLNNKINLLQAEAIADLIDSNSKKAALGAMQSLQGAFSDNVKTLRDKVFNAKALIEAALDFPDEEDVDINTAPAAEDIQTCLNELDMLLKKTEAGRVLDHNPTIAIIGRPNAGKSSIINYLSGMDSAIVSKTPGTTRDIIKEKILMQGYAVTLLDTAGIRETTDEIERAGVDRAQKALNMADILLHVHDINDVKPDENGLIDIPVGMKVITVNNKIDLCSGDKFVHSDNAVYVSAKTGAGMDVLVDRVCRHLDMTGSEEGLVFSRQRHVDVLRVARNYLENAVVDNGLGLEVQAESMRQCLSCFDELTGRTTSDDVLGAIFSQFCIGK